MSSNDIEVSSVLAKCREMLEFYDYTCLHGLTINKCAYCRPDRIQNIGQIDALGCFRLHRAIEALLETRPPEGILSKYKHAKRSKKERTAELQAEALMEGWRRELVKEDFASLRLYSGKTK